MTLMHMLLLVLYPWNYNLCKGSMICVWISTEDCFYYTSRYILWKELIKYGIEGSDILIKPKGHFPTSQDDIKAQQGPYNCYINFNWLFHFRQSSWVLQELPIVKCNIQLAVKCDYERQCSRHLLQMLPFCIIIMFTSNPCFAMWNNW